MSHQHNKRNRDLLAAISETAQETLDREQGELMLTQLRERLMREPVVSERAEEWIYSREASADLRQYHSGEQIGYYRGHEAGFAKGAAVTALATLGTVLLGGLTLYFKYKD